MDKPYNGHKNWRYWNVSLWIGNDEGLYNLARECKRNNRRSLNKAAHAMYDLLCEMQACKPKQHALDFDKIIVRTPDGARYSPMAIRAAMVDL